MNSFVGKAKAYLDNHEGDRVTLQELAASVGVSPFHLQRRFKAAFGVSPSVYQAARRLERVKVSLKRSARVTDALLEAGYGSLSRFYEKPMLGMKAREYRANGRGQRIEYCSFPSPLGTVLVGTTAKGLCALKIGDDPAWLARLLAEEFSAAQLVEVRNDALRKAVLGFLAGNEALARLPLDLRGTVFQRRVWDALRRIPRGETRTYRELAQAVGAPAAVRAVGSACGANPVALAVPCHRAVRTDGGLGGYAWGLARKKKLLTLEKKSEKSGSGS